MALVVYATWYHHFSACEEFVNIVWKLFFENKTKRKWKRNNNKEAKKQYHSYILT